jgi:hypothetical protein
MQTTLHPAIHVICVRRLLLATRSLGSHDTAMTTATKTIRPGGKNQRDSMPDATRRSTTGVPRKRADAQRKLLGSIREMSHTRRRNAFALEHNPLADGWAVAHHAAATAKRGCVEAHSHAAVRTSRATTSDDGPMRWGRRPEREAHPVTREELTTRHDAFAQAHRALAARMAGHSEDEVRSALARLLAEHRQALSVTELELWTLEIADPEWAAKDPQRAARLMEQLGAEPGDPGSPQR